MKASRIFFSVILICVLLAGCGVKKGINEVETIKDLSYDINPSSGYTVYVKENSTYQPYLVLSNNYGGNVLLLRKFLLAQPMPFNDYYSYYEDSEIDKYLNTDFLSRFSKSMRDQIVSSKIQITKKNAIGIVGHGTKQIGRKIFLLSTKEVGLTEITANDEGKVLNYFDNPSRRIAIKEDTNRACSWWLRTPDISYESCSWGIGPKATYGSGNAYSKNGIRPAFCVNKTLKVKKSKDIIQGKNLYCFSCDS